MNLTEEQTKYFSRLYEKYADDMYRLCLVYLKRREDAEEAVTDAFIRAMERAPSFENEAHEKGWLMKTTVNICRNMLRSAWTRYVVSNDEVLSYMATPEEISVMEEVLSLPPKYRVIIYMHYYQGYKAAEIAKMLGMNESTVLSRLSRGRQKLREILTQGGVSYV